MTADLLVEIPWLVFHLCWRSKT